MGNADAVRGLRRSNRRAQRSTIRRREAGVFGWARYIESHHRVDEATFWRVVYRVLDMLYLPDGGGLFITRGIAFDGWLYRRLAAVSGAQWNAPTVGGVAC